VNDGAEAAPYNPGSNDQDIQQFEPKPLLSPFTTRTARAVRHNNINDDFIYY
jgi:hypothetical protein